MVEQEKYFKQERRLRKRIQYAHGSYCEVFLFLVLLVSRFSTLLLSIYALFDHIKKNDGRHITMTSIVSKLSEARLEEAQKVL